MEAGGVPAAAAALVATPAAAGCGAVAGDRPPAGPTVTATTDANGSPGAVRLPPTDPVEAVPTCRPARDDGGAHRRQRHRPPRAPS
ncbi:hypothetical protein HBB16_09270 [Pseudonocardia sp. MCCB 268]|nr:hypothetical protein [Pseudonocardia cytotoxica]